LPFLCAKPISSLVHRLIYCTSILSSLASFCADFYRGLLLHVFRETRRGRRSVVIRSQQSPQPPKQGGGEDQDAADEGGRHEPSHGARWRRCLPGSGDPHLAGHGHQRRWPPRGIRSHAYGVNSERGHIAAFCYDDHGYRLDRASYYLWRPSYTTATVLVEETKAFALGLMMLLIHVNEIGNTRGLIFHGRS